MNISATWSHGRERHQQQTLQSMAFLGFQNYWIWEWISSSWPKSFPSFENLRKPTNKPRRRREGKRTKSKGKLTNHTSQQLSWSPSLSLKQYAITIHFYFFGFEWCVINAREKERKLTFYNLEKEMYKQVSTGLSSFDLFLDSSCYNSLVANLTPKLAIVQNKPGYLTYFADISLSTYHNLFPSSNYA